MKPGPSTINEAILEIIHVADRLIDRAEKQASMALTHRRLWIFPCGEDHWGMSNALSAEAEDLFKAIHFIDHDYKQRDAKIDAIQKKLARLALKAEAAAATPKPQRTSRAPRQPEPAVASTALRLLGLAA